MKVTVGEDHIDLDDVAAIHSPEPVAVGVREACVVYLKGGAIIHLDPYLGRLVLDAWGKGRVDLVHRDNHARKR